MPERKQIIRVVGYPRISDPSREDGSELISQAKEITRYVEAHSEFQLIDMMPEAMTAYMKPFKDRKVFMAIMDTARKGLIDGVVVTEYGRLSRRQGEQAVIVELLRGYNVKVYSCTENFDESALGQFMRAAAAFSAESEREKMVYRTTRGMQDRVEAGNLTGRGSALYGYDYADSELFTNAYYVINAEEAKWRLWMFERSDEGWSDRKIAKTLTEMGIPTKTGKKQWHYGTVATLLKDPACTGVHASAMRYRQQENGRSIKESPIGKIPLPSHVVPQIVSEELFDRVQRQRAMNKELSFRNNKHPKTHLMRGFLFCGVCGHRMHVDNKLKEGKIVRANYFCHKNRGGEDPISHHSLSIATHMLDEEAWKLAVSFIKNPTLIRERIAALREQNSEIVDIERINTMLKDVRARYLRLFDLAESATDDDTYAELKIRLVAIEKEKHDLERLLTDFTLDKEDAKKINAEIDRFEEWAASVRTLLDDASYVPDFDDKLAAIKVLGIRGKVWPIGSEHRLQLLIAPPSLMDILDKAGIRANCADGLTIALSCARLPAPITIEPCGNAYSPILRS